MKVKKAVALKYEQQSDVAPKVVAKGAGEVAEAILRLGQAEHIHVYEDEALTSALMALELESVIPEELYAVVAEVLAVVYRSRE